MATNNMEFECTHCGKMFARRWFDLSRALERVHYKSPESLDEVEIEAAEGIGAFCSRGCLNAGRPAAMSAEGVPIPAVRPGLGPVESCAKCSGPVDMSDWHLTSTDGCMEEQGNEVRVLAVDYVAVVCRKCAPRSQAGDSAEPREILVQPAQGRRERLACDRSRSREISS